MWVSSAQYPTPGFTALWPAPPSGFQTGFAQGTIHAVATMDRITAKLGPILTTVLTGDPALVMAVVTHIMIRGVTWTAFQARSTPRI